MSVVTGASRGIGRYIALGLAQAGHDLILVGRSADRIAAATYWILDTCPRTKIEIAIADLSLLGETQRVGDAIAASGRSVDILVNNAGVFTHRREETAEGHDRVIAVNHLAPFVLTRAVLPVLAPGGRIVNLGSSTSDIARIDPDDLDGHRKWGMMRNYAQSKLALLIVTATWADLLRPQGVTANTVHPGSVATGLVRAGGAIGIAWRGLAHIFLTEEQGAATPLRAALSKEFAGVSGAYLKKQGRVGPNRLALDEALAQRVWEATVRMTYPA